MEYGAAGLRPLPSVFLSIFTLGSHGTMKHQQEYCVLLFVLLYLCTPLCLPLTSPLFASEDRPFRPGVWVWAGFTFSCVVSLLLPLGNIRTFFGALLLLYVHKEYPKYTTGKVHEDYLIAANIVLTSFKFVDFVYLRVPEDAAYRVNASGEPIEDVKSLRNATYSQRLKWAASLFSTFRGVGWNWRVKNVEIVPQGTKRFAFAFRQVVGFVYCYLAIDVLTYYLRLYPATLSRGEDDYFALPLISQIRIAWMLALRSGFEMSVSYYLVAAVAVCTGLFEPESWPPFFGSFDKGYTLRNIWGKCWHQNLRRTFETYGSLLCEKAGITQGSLGSAYLKLYFSFFLSAFIHNTAAMNHQYIPAVKYQFWFFLLQPVAITIEDLVCFFGGSGRDYDRGGTNKRGTVKASAKQKAIGYLWVFVFLSISLRYMAAYVVACGFVALEHPLTKVFSVARYVLAN